MRNLLKIVVCILILNSSTFTVAQETINIIPKPVSLKVNKGFFYLTKNTSLKASNQLKNEAMYFAEQVFISTGFQINNEDISNLKSNLIELKIDDSIQKKYGNEAYRLVVAKNKIKILAGNKKGVFYGLQTLLQLLPQEVYSRSRIDDMEWSVPFVEILDYPRFGWRGFMLDASRTFQPVSYVKKTLDLMAIHKLNVFHWHLTDDHGWRIEIKKYPWLTQVGAWRNQPNYPVKGEINPYGGFYTQKQIRDIVNYAAERHITIVPEVDLPGHSSALVYAMPEMVCDSVEKQHHIQYFRDYPTRSTNYIKHPGSNVVCAGKESVYPVIKNILNEIIDLFPSEYIHVGGDEVKKNWWNACPHCQARVKKEGLGDMDELQAYFIRRLEKMLNARGRQLIGWDEILQGGLSKTASVMGWRGIGEVDKSLKEGRATVVACHQGYYIQRSQTKNPFHPQAWPSISTPKSIYEFNPVPDNVTPKEEKLILGIQTSLWSNSMNNENLSDLASFPRNCALSEAAWTPKESKNWKDFENRLNNHLTRLDYLGVSYWRENTKEIGDWDTSELWKASSVLNYNISKHIEKPGVYFVLGDLEEGSELVIEEAVVFMDGLQISSDKHLGYISKDRNHDRIYFLDFQNIDKKASYELQLKVKGTLGKVTKGKIYLLHP